MQPTLPTTILALLPIFSSAIPLGVPLVVSPGLNITTPAQRDRLNCSDLSQGPSETCYRDLNITAYLTNYNTSILPEVCPPSVPWSRCFQDNAYTNASSPTNLKLTEAKHNCSLLTTNASNSDSCMKPALDEQHWTAGEYYGVFNIWSLQHHISIWAQALNAPSSQKAITNVTVSDSAADSDAQTATSVLATLIESYSVDREADDYLVRLLEAEPNASKVPARPNGTHQRVASYAGQPTASAWQPVLTARLAEVLALAMDDFDFFIEVVRQGSYSTDGLAVVGQLEEALKGVGRE